MYYDHSELTFQRGPQALYLHQDHLDQTVFPQMIYLLTADFTQGTWSALIPGLFVRMGTWRAYKLDKMAVLNFNDKVLKSSRLLMDKVKERKSGSR